MSKLEEHYEQLRSEGYSHNDAISRMARTLGVERGVVLRALGYDDRDIGDR